MAAVLVIPYCKDWPDVFCSLKEELVRVLEPLPVVVEHIGSTSVPGLASKPVIDILLGTISLADIELKIACLGESGYRYVPKYEAEIPMRRYFVKPAADWPRIHLHAVELGSPIWVEYLTFRDALRHDSNLRSEYQYLKLQLAEKFADNKSAYTCAKDPFIKSVLADAATKPYCMLRKHDGFDA